MPKSTSFPVCVYCDRGHPPIVGKVLLDADDVTHIYNLSRRQQKRLVADGRLARVKTAGPTGPVAFLRCDLDDLVRRSRIPAGKPAGRKPQKRS